MSRISRLSRLSLNPGSSRLGSRRSSRLVKSTRPSRDVLAQQCPEDAAGDALDQVVAVEERAAVDGEEAHARRPPPSSGSPAPRRRLEPGDASLARRARGPGRARWRCRASSRPRRRSCSSLAPKATGLLAVDHEHADERAERHGRHDQPAVGVGESRHRAALAPGRDAAGVHELLTDRTGVLRHLPQVADAHRLAAGGGDADRPVADDHLGADAVGVEAAAADRVEASPSSSSSSRCTWW